nr:MAG TPA: major capsid protein [Bacteriophage sp.]
MSKMQELMEKRAKTWEGAKAFLDTHRQENGTISAEDNATYEKMEADVVALGKEIERLKRQKEIDAELSKATSTPITEKPQKNAVENDEKKGRATDEYKKQFWNSMRKKNFFDVSNVLTIGEDAEGGYLVPDEYEKKLVEGLEDEVFFRGMAHVIRTSSGDRKIPIITGHGEAAWLDEGEQFTESDDTFGQTSISAYKLGTLIKVSDELLNDSVFDLAGYISREFARRIGAKEEEAFFIGDGKGKPAGIFDTKGGAQTGVTTSGTGITFDDVMDLYYSLRAPYRNKASWILNDSTVKAIRKLKDANGNYIWQPSVREGEPDRILNRPYKTSIYVPELATGNRVMSFGDYSYYWIADRQGRSFKRLNELYATTGHVGFLACERLDGKLILPEAVKTMDIKGNSKAGQ